MRYGLRTLLILLAIGPPLVAGAWAVASKAIADHLVKPPIVFLRLEDWQQLTLRGSRHAKRSQSEVWKARKAAEIESVGGGVTTIVTEPNP